MTKSKKILLSPLGEMVPMVLEGTQRSSRRLVTTNKAKLLSLDLVISPIRQKTAHTDMRRTSVLMARATKEASHVVHPVPTRRLKPAHPFAARETGRQTDRQTERQTHTHTHTHTHARAHTHTHTQHTQHTPHNTQHTTHNTHHTTHNTQHTQH